MEVMSRLKLRNVDQPYRNMVRRSTSVVPGEQINDKKGHNCCLMLRTANCCLRSGTVERAFRTSNPRPTVLVSTNQSLDA
nr:hypothetical protein CFP56_19474 [Quercus suber]